MQGSFCYSTPVSAILGLCGAKLPHIIGNTIRGVPKPCNAYKPPSSSNRSRTPSLWARAARVSRRDEEVSAAALEILEAVAAFLIGEGVPHSTGRKLLQLAYARAGWNTVAPGVPRHKFAESKLGTHVAEVTGLPRHELKALLSENVSAETLSQVDDQQRAQRILAEWHANPRYQNEDGTPAFLRQRGPRSFTELASRYSPDDRGKPSLQILLAAKAVKRRKDRTLQVLRKTLATSKMDSAGLSAFGQVIGEHIQSIRRNAQRKREEPELFAVRFQTGPLDKDRSDLLKVRIGERLQSFSDGLRLEMTDPGHAPTAQSREIAPPLAYVGYLVEVEDHDDTMLASAASVAAARRGGGKAVRRDNRTTRRRR
jgi:hypothetical protein